MPPSSSFHPVIQELQQILEKNKDLREQVEGMFMAIPNRTPYDVDSAGKPQIRDYMTLLTAFNSNLTRAPEFYENENLPYDAILYWPRQTKCGQKLFSDDRINDAFTRIFEVWSKFLTSRDSCYVLTADKHGWFGSMARDAMPDFDGLFECDPKAPHHGFKSWDDFFTRRFRPGRRPVKCANDDTEINNACESTVYRIAYNVKERDKFWVKGYPYSLHHMLGGDSLASMFAGGTILQSYLSTTYYHRWHSPVNGVIHKIVTIPGKYYACSPSDAFIGDRGFVAADLDQAFLTSSATRMLIFIKADNPKIGVMCFIAVGMEEVSTCEATVRVGQRVKKGQETGMFHFGGSTHCLIFRPQTKISFASYCRVGSKVNVNEVIATVP